MFKKFSRVLVLTAAVLAAVATTGPPGAARAAPPVKGDGGIVFSYLGPDAQAVYIAGDFNNWNAQDLPMTRQDSGDWTISVPLDPGKYEYKFIADGNWIEDPDNPEKKSDPFGGSNSLVTIGSDGSVALAAAGAGAVAAGAGAATDQESGALPEDIAVGRPIAVDGGILFTYRDSGAGSVTLAGSFNGWNATDNPLTDDGQGNWAIVQALDPGEHEYKFVVDGAWFADPENPDTKTDPYGGSNSLVIVGDDGQLLASGAVVADDGGNQPNTNLNAKLYMDGRYLTRFQYAKNVAVDVGDESAVDSRYRLQRPTQSVDLNFHADVSDIASTFTRLRLDSDQNIIQNNIAGFLDEANLVIHPKNFDMKVYWNQEVFTSHDLLQLGGNIDLPGSIYHDHIDYGKGSAGLLFDADPIGIKTVVFFANVHNHDYYDDPDLYDNTGEDKIGLRLSKKIGPIEIGAPVWIERSMVWLDFETEAGLPSTGIPALDEHRAKTNDTSTWYETETHNYNLGLDLRINLSDKFMIGGQGNYVDLQQRFVTGNRSSETKQNGQLDVPFLERDRRMVLGQIDFNPSENMKFSLKHIAADMKGANPDQRMLQYNFLDQDVANKQIYFTIEDAPASTQADSTDLTWDWHTGSLDLGIWLRRTTYDKDYAPLDLTVPADNTLTSHTEELLEATLMLGLGNTGDFLGHGEIEFAYKDADAGVASMEADSYELIFRYDRDLTRNTGFIADLRFINYSSQGNDENGDLVTDKSDFFNPFVGFRYTPIKKLELVLAYGVDPLDYSIEYSGRQLGRWWFRQNYMFDHPDATLLEAENHLADAQVFTLRAQLLF